MGELHEELAGERVQCKLCLFLEDLPLDGENGSESWRHELRHPPETVSHASVARALARRGLKLSESSVRRHRSGHEPV